MKLPLRTLERIESQTARAATRVNVEWWEFLKEGS
jgi:hypothetical protein